MLGKQFWGEPDRMFPRKLIVTRSTYLDSTSLTSLTASPRLFMIESRSGFSSQVLTLRRLRWCSRSTATPPSMSLGQLRVITAFFFRHRSLVLSSCGVSGYQETGSSFCALRVLKLRYSRSRSRFRFRVPACRYLVLGIAYYQNPRKSRLTNLRY